MKDFITAFLNASDYTEATQESYRYALTRLDQWLTERGLTIDGLTVAHYQMFLGGQGWSNNMRRLYASAIRSFLRWLGHKSHPVFGVKLPKDNARPGRAFTQAEMGDLLAVFDTTTPAGWRNVAMLALMLETGLRISAVCRLRLVDVDVERRTFVALEKNRKWREGVFSDLTASYLATWLALRPRLVRGKDCGRVFISHLGKTPGQKMTPGGLRKLFRAWGTLARIGRLSPHDMRRTMAMLLTEAGAPTRLVQELGGWEDIRMVERYTRRLRPGQIDRYSPLIALMGLAVGAANPPAPKPRQEV